MNPNLIIPEQFVRTPGDRAGPAKRQRHDRFISPEAEADRVAYHIAAACIKLNKKARRRGT